jgi:hypothetical protein
MRRLAPAAAALLFLGCPSGLEEQSRVSKLRVLGVRAEPPELILEPGSPLPAATLTALAVEPSGIAISVQFALCTRLGDAPSPTLPCPGSAGIDLPDAGPLAARLDLADPRILAFAAQAQLDGGAFDAGGIALGLDQGVPLLVGFTALAGQQKLDGFESITLRSPARGPVNQNPEITGLQVGDGSPVHANQKVRLQPLTAPKDDATERYGFSFFATAGNISSLRSTDTTATGQPAPTWVEWTAPASPQPVRFWVVVRDGRGGTGWLHQNLDVQ